MWHSKLAKVHTKGLHMLPDYPELKTRFGDFLQSRMYELLGAFPPVPKTLRKEGHRGCLVRHDGSIQELNRAPVCSRISVSRDEFGAMSVEDVLKKVDEAAEDMARQRDEAFFKLMDEVCEQAGNVLSAQGTPVSAEHLLRALKKVDIDFDDQGKPFLPTAIAGEKVASQIREAGRQLETDPVWRRRYSRLMDLKKDEWRAREADRRLVG